MEPPIDQPSLWIECDLLATASRLAQGWRLGPGA
jgi:hypothetical protein